MRVLVVNSVVSDVVYSKIDKHSAGLGAAFAELARAVGQNRPSKARLRVRLEVDDNGPGIAKDERDQLLLRGVRGDERVEGHGLGLAIVLEIVSAYHGDIDITQGELGGACVSVTLKTR